MANITYMKQKQNGLQNSLGEQEKEREMIIRNRGWKRKKNKVEMANITYMKQKQNGRQNSLGEQEKEREMIISKG